MEIQLTRGKVAIVDADDFERLSKFKWCAIKSSKGKTWYARRWTARGKGKQAPILMHREILNILITVLLDHKNGNGLDNRKENLRISTCSQNNQNRSKPKNNTSGIKGVYWNKRNKKWMARIQANHKVHYLGYFHELEDAATAYYNEAIRLHGEFARLTEL
jgi:hypothetical protein